MRNMLEAPFLRGMRKVAGIMYDKFWDERNGGNISLML
ncbi:MAG: rhamnulose-1-phosphate aldolase, partial [Clostridiales bacterium]|nr:rhamnulose-1-phosphate aldolase [Clostridiales bacterium]